MTSRRKPSFGKRYKALRKKQGISNYFVEQVTGYSRSNLSNLEAGKFRPSDELLRLLASVRELKISVAELQRWRAEDDYPDLLPPAIDLTDAKKGVSRPVKPGRKKTLPLKGSLPTLPQNFFSPKTDRVAWLQTNFTPDEIRQALELLGES